MAVKCKRIIDGKTYNTETATELDGWYTDSDEHPIETSERLFQNRFGAFFLWHYQSDGPYGPEEDIIPFTPERAKEWLIQRQQVDLIESLFGKLPEAGSGETKFTLRMPDNLKDRLAERAKTNGQSLNAWIIRCLEACVAEPASKDTGVPTTQGNKAAVNRPKRRT